jgi:chemotaxis protein histidine kinase CheA/ActR/RegA family two-component response regulator
MQPDQQQRIMGYFIEEAKDHLNTIEQGLLNLQSTIADSEMVNEVFRAAHSIKGGAAMLGIHSIQRTAHSLEDYFKVLKEAPVQVDQKLETLFLQVLDTLQRLLEQLQGPFGLTDDIANQTMLNIEPVFQELDRHLQTLVAQSGGVAASPAAVVAGATTVQPAQVFAQPQDSSLILIFQRDVPTRLREMLQLFKQPDTQAGCREQLQALCQNLASFGEQFGLPEWCNLLETAEQAIGNPDVTNRALAPIVIKDIKQAQELVLAGRASEIAACDQLRELVPAPVELLFEDDFSDLLAISDDDLVTTEDLTDSFQLDSAFAAMSADSLPTVDESVFDNWLVNETPTHEAELPNGISADLGFEPIEQNGPEVGMAELNSLADLFEGEVPDLGSTWQEEEIISEPADTPEFSIHESSATDDSSNDFSDLLFDEKSTNLEPARTAADDLTALFGDSLLDEESAETNVLSDFEAIDLSENINLNTEEQDSDALSALLDATEQFNGFEAFSGSTSEPEDLLQEIDLSGLEQEDAAPFNEATEAAAIDNLGEFFDGLHENALENSRLESDPTNNLDTNPAVIADPWETEEPFSAGLSFGSLMPETSELGEFSLSDLAEQTAIPPQDEEDLGSLFGDTDLNAESANEILVDSPEDYSNFFNPSSSSDLIGIDGIEALVEDSSGDLAIEELVQSASEDSAIDDWLNATEDATTSEDIPLAETAEPDSLSELLNVGSSDAIASPPGNQVPDPWSEDALSAADRTPWNETPTSSDDWLGESLDNLPIAEAEALTESPFSFEDINTAESSLFDESTPDPLASLLDAESGSEINLESSSLEELNTENTEAAFADMLGAVEPESPNELEFPELGNSAETPANSFDDFFATEPSTAADLGLGLEPNADLDLDFAAVLSESSDDLGDLFGEQSTEATNNLQEADRLNSETVELFEVESTSSTMDELGFEAIEPDSSTAEVPSLDLEVGDLFESASGSSVTADDLGFEAFETVELFEVESTSSAMDELGFEAIEPDSSTAEVPSLDLEVEDLFESASGSSVTAGDLGFEALETVELFEVESTPSTVDELGFEAIVEPDPLTAEVPSLDLEVGDLFESPSDSAETTDFGLEAVELFDVPSDSAAPTETTDELDFEAELFGSSTAPVENSELSLDFETASSTPTEDLLGLDLTPAPDLFTEVDEGSESEDLDDLLGLDNSIAPTPPESFNNLFATEADISPEFSLGQTAESSSEVSELDALLEAGTMETPEVMDSLLDTDSSLDFLADGEAPITQAESDLDDLLSFETGDDRPAPSDPALADGFDGFGAMFGEDFADTSSTQNGSEHPLESTLDFDNLDGLTRNDVDQEVSNLEADFLNLELPHVPESSAASELSLDDELLGQFGTDEVDIADISASDTPDFLTASSGFDDLDALLDAPTTVGEAEVSTHPLSEDFADLEALLEPTTAAAPGDAFANPAASVASPSESTDEFDDLDKLLEDANEKLGGSPAIKSVRGPSPRTSTRKPRPGGMEQLMRVPVKHLDNLSNLVGELVVNRNSLEQDQERLRQSLDNLLYQVQQLSDVGQRMQDLYERSLLESSLLASRQGYRPTLQAMSRETVEPQGGGHSTTVEYDPLEMDRFTGFHSLSQEMIELIVRVRESASDIEFIVDETDQVTRMFRQVTTQLQEGLTRSRMVPFAQMADRLPRAVRDNALKYKKQAALRVEGRDTLIDKMILDQLTAPGGPLDHLINNAIAHGIELPEVRQNAGKPAVGQITVSAFHQGNQTVISVSDDGAGVDIERVKAKAIEKGLITPSEATSMSRLDVYELLFHPGFSTKDKADDLAGRGVGMDVVLSNLSLIRGTISTDSSLGKGTSFTIRLPLTLSISKALCCISDRARIAFPMDGVEDMLDIPKERIQTNAEGQPCISWRDTLLPLRPLTELLTYSRHLSRGNVYGGNQEEDMVSVVVLRSAGNFLALQVDQVLGEQEIVIKQLEGPVPKPVGVAGATVLGDGRIMPIADVLELIDLSVGRIRRDISGGTLWEQAGGQPVQEPPITKSEPMVLIVDDSITVRELLSMTFNKVGYRVEQARDGQEAWEKLRSGLPCDIVFCDIEMPRMDGLELLSRIQKDPNLSDLPIAMLTSRGADRHRQMAASLGASGYFTKPYLEEALLDAAQRMLKGEKLISATA